MERPRSSQSSGKGSDHRRTCDGHRPHRHRNAADFHPSAFRAEEAGEEGIFQRKGDRIRSRKFSEGLTPAMEPAPRGLFCPPKKVAFYFKK